MRIQETMQIDSQPPVPLYICGPGSSSMDAAWEFMAEGRLPLWASLLMESQSSGRGRMGRVWQSPPGHVYAALRLPLAPPFDGPGASLALAFLLRASFAEAFDYGWNFDLKWPNDLIFEGGKVGGILLESRGENLVAGVGFNLVAPPEGEWRLDRDPAAPPPVALPFSGGPVKLWAALVKQIIVLYNKKFGGLSMKEVAEKAENFLLWRGQNVTVFQPASEPPAPENPLRGRIKGLGPEGQLILENSRGRYALWSGLVSPAQ